ncbi:MAG: DNA polymerase III subunit beta [Sulfuricella sp.]|nr:DNA polymerase III subunit beta [Gammaproteobacteria bacterium]
MLLIQTNRDALLKPLQCVIGIVERRHTLPILANVLLEKNGNTLSVLATDLEIQITATSTCSDEFPDFSVTVAAKKLQDICKAFPESAQISLKIEESRLQIKVGKSRFNLQTLPAADFPTMVSSTENRSIVKIGQKTLKNLLNQVQYAMAQQDIRYYLNGLLLVIEPTLFRVVATDGHRLSMVSHPLEEETLATNNSTQEVILPRKTVIELIKLLGDSEDEISLEIGQNHTRLSFSNIVLVSKIIEGKFPDYNRVVPSNYQNQMQIDRMILLQALQRAAILSNEKFRGVRLVLTQNSLRVICNNNEQEEAQEDIEVSYLGDPLDIGFNVNYLLDVLMNVNNDSIVISFGDANSSGLFTVPGNEYFKYVVMPMRI